jgi:hypothetical protein
VAPPSVEAWPAGSFASASQTRRIRPRSGPARGKPAFGPLAGAAAMCRQPSSRCAGLLGVLERLV